MDCTILQEQETDSFTIFLIVHLIRPIIVTLLPLLIETNDGGETVPLVTLSQKGTTTGKLRLCPIECRCIGTAGRHEKLCN